MNPARPRRHRLHSLRRAARGGPAEGGGVASIAVGLVTSFLLLTSWGLWPSLSPRSVALFVIAWILFGIGLATWVFLTISFLGAYLISYYFASSTVVYYLMRREVDATDLDRSRGVRPPPPRQREAGGK